MLTRKQKNGGRYPVAVSLRLTDHELSLFDRASERAGQHRSVWMRERLVELAEKQVSALKRRGG